MKRDHGQRSSRAGTIPKAFKAILLAAACLAAKPALAAEARVASRYVWQSDDPRIGGLSGLEVDAEGVGFVALIDRGRILEGRFLRLGDRITGLDVSTAFDLLGPDGTPLEDEDDDSEGLAFDSDGGVYVSFEGPARVWHYDGLLATPTEIALTREFAQMQQNAGLEALAALEDGSLVTMPERTGRQDRPFPLYHYAGDRWGTLGDLARVGPFLAVGADLGPDGYLYVLERDFVGIGFRSQIRRVDLSSGANETLLTSARWEFDNLEGISAWRDAQGRIRLIAVSDKNFIGFQKTEFVEFIVSD